MKHAREELEDFSFHALRNLAREVGVKAPTALRKSELIEEILLIESGKKEPKKPNNKGRPTKKMVMDRVALENIKLDVEKDKINKEFADLIVEKIRKFLYDLI